MSKHLPKLLKTTPTTPGIYQFLDSKGEILYVGKAKSLRPRVQSYFRNSAALDQSKQEMVKKIKDIKTISTDTETEALVLEANLIRRLQPPYNVLLRDDKFYLFIKITKEKYPRVFPVRQIKKDKARYFGPYSSATSVRHTLNLLRRIFPYYTEKDSPRDQIFPHPLFGRRPKSAQRSSQSEVGLPNKQYHSNIQNIIKFLQGHRSEIINTLKQGMKESSAAKQYERAAIFRDQLRAIERLEGNQKVYLPSKESFDIISIARNKSVSAANIFSLRDGKLLNKNTFLLKHRALTPNQDVLRQFILQYYSQAQDPPNIILIPGQLEDADTIAKWINPNQPPTLSIPRRGKKKQLLNMGLLNAQQLLTQEEAEFITATRNKQALKELAKALNIKSKLTRIETYDISNIQGKLATGSMVVFENGQPDKSQYKKFKIKTKDTPDDFYMMQEVLTRRFKNHQTEGSPPLRGGVRGGDKNLWPLPDLVIIDGGKGQLNAAKKILDELKIKSALISLAKREETIFTYITDPEKNTSPRTPLLQKERGPIKEVRLKFDSPSLFLIQQMRDEAHRFTITYHRLLRSKKQQRSILDEVPGIGPATKKKLLNHFGSLKKIRAAEDNELTQIIGLTKTETLRDYL